jgi:NADPH:quinone reductase-like Zn-dependent oxidoreductase
VRAAQIVEYGPPSVIQVADIPRPQPQSGQLLVRVKAVGVGPWDAPIREGRSGVPQTLPLTLGSDIAGAVDAMGADVSGFAVGNEVYGLTTTISLATTLNTLSPRHQVWPESREFRSQNCDGRDVRPQCPRKEPEIFSLRAWRIRGSRKESEL